MWLRSLSLSILIISVCDGFVVYRLLFCKCGMIWVRRPHRLYLLVVEQTKHGNKRKRLKQTITLKCDSVTRMMTCRCQSSAFRFAFRFFCCCCGLSTAPHRIFCALDHFYFSKMMSKIICKTIYSIAHIMNAMLNVSVGVCACVPINFNEFNL